MSKKDFAPGSRTTALLLICAVSLLYASRAPAAPQSGPQILHVETLATPDSCTIRIIADQAINHWRLKSYPKKNQFKVSLAYGKLASDPLQWTKLNQDSIAYIKNIGVERDGENLDIVIDFDPAISGLPLQTVNRIDKGMLLQFGPAAATLVNPPFQKPGRWRAFANVTARPGSERSFWETELYWPFWQDNDSLVMLTLRAQQSDQDTEEYNGGFAYRRIVNNNAVFGTYLLFDTFTSASNKDYDQLTYGAEYLGETMDFRINYYKPDDDENLVSSTIADPGDNTVVFAGDDIQIVHSGQTSLNVNETALPGYDISFAQILPDWLTTFDESRIVLTGFSFDKQGYDPIKGERIGYETRLYDVEWLGDDSRITMGLEWQDDDVRESETFAYIKLTIPLGSSTRDHSITSMRDLRLHRRMLDPIIRDIDIVANTRTETVDDEDVIEDALDPVSGELLRDQYLFAEAGASGSGTRSDPADLSAALATAASTGQTVILNGDGGNFIVVPTASCPGNPLCGTATQGDISLPANLAIIGAGNSNLVFTATSESGYTANYTLPGTRPTLEWNDNGAAGAAEAFFNLNNNNTLAGLDFLGSNQGALAAININNNASGVRLDNIAFRNTTFMGIRANNNADYTLNDISFITPDAVTLGSFTAISAGNNNTATLSGINVNASGDLTSSGVVIDNTGDFDIRNSVFDAGVGLQITTGNPTITIRNNTFDSQAGGFGIAILGNGSYQINNNTIDSDTGMAITASPNLSGSGNIFNGTTLCNNTGTPTGSAGFNAGSCP